jgi:2-amino-4-hydroxy-6-hydroxymethyldihydropteridine diphosphokinase
MARKAPPGTEVAVISLGANLGDGAKALRTALAALQTLPACHLIEASSLYRSAPVDAAGPDYWNAVVAMHCGLTPEALLARLQRLEHEHGRERLQGVHNAPRTLDLDLLLFGSRRVHDERLVLPHPRMHLRAFVLVPLAEIWPHWTLPDGESVAHAARRLQQAGQQIQRVGPLAIISTRS